MSAKLPKRWKEITASEFESLSDAEKERHFQEIERGTPLQRRAESVAPTPSEQKTLKRIRRKIGRPKIGRGTKAVAVTIEIDLLRRADSRARQLGLGRSEFFSQGLRAILQSRSKKSA